MAPIQWANSVVEGYLCQMSCVSCRDDDKYFNGVPDKLASMAPKYRNTALPVCRKFCKRILEVKL